MPDGKIRLKKPPPKTQKRSTKRIEMLPEDVRADLDARLERGDKAEEVVIALQEEWGECLDLKREYLRHVMIAYRDGPLRARVIARGVGAAGGASMATLTARVNALTELEELTRKQLQRVEKVRATEASMPLTMKSVSDEIKLAVNMLARLARLQLETGYLARAPRFAPSGGEKDGEVPVNSWDSASEALLAQLQEEGDV